MRRQEWTRRTIALGGALLSTVVLGQIALSGPVAAVPGLMIRTTVGPSNSVAKSQNADLPGRHHGHRRRRGDHRVGASARWAWTSCSRWPTPASTRWPP